MNIFVTDISPVKSAEALDDKRLIKMVLESAQLLSTSIFVHSHIVHAQIYKPTHLKHPCTLWACKTSANWQWLFDHLVALCIEYTRRYNRAHKTSGILSHLTELKFHIEEGPMTDFVNCTSSESMKVDFRNISNVQEAYRLYLASKWNYDKLPPKWTNRQAPNWYNSY